MVVAVAALVVAGTGVGAAATGLINGSQIRNGTIAGAKLKNSTITGTKIANRTITAGKLASGVLKAYRFQLTPANEGFYFNDSHDAAYALVGALRLLRNLERRRFEPGPGCLLRGRYRRGRIY